MDKALKGVPVASYSPPSGITTARINPETGLRGNGATLEEYFMEEQLPPEEEDPIDITIRSVEDIINDFLSN